MSRTSLIQAEVHAPAVVEVPEGAETVEIAVRADLHNVGDNDYVLHNVGDDAHFWHVLDENHREVLRDRTKKKRDSKKSGDVHPIRTQTIPAGLSTHTSVTLTLETKKLKDGKTYTVRSENWGQLAETTFVAVRKQASAPPKPKKKQAPKKTAAAKKTTATKKTTAKKSTAKRKSAKGSKS